MDNEKVIREGMEDSKEGAFNPEELTTVQPPEQETPAAPSGDMSPAGEQTADEGPSATPAAPSGDLSPTDGQTTGEGPAEAPAGEAAAAGEPAAAASEEPPVSVKEKKSFLRSCGSWTDIIPIAAMLSVILTLFGSLLSLILDESVVPATAIGMKLLGDADSVEFLLEYFEFYGIWIAFVIVILLFKDNWPMWKAFLYNRHGNNLKAILAGILLGFGLNGTCILLSVIMGDIKLSYSGFAPVPFFAFLISVLIQSGAEEIVDRCYLYQKLRRRYRWPIIAVLVNSLIFMSLHMGNPGVTKLGLLQVFLIGVLFSLIVYYWDSLWTAIWAHAAWNFSQSIVFGLPNSGIVSKYSVLKLEAASARDGLFYNTGFGVEGSLGANVMIGAVIVIILIYALVTKRGERKDHWEQLEKRDAGKNHIWEAVVLTFIMIAVMGAFFMANIWLDNHADEIGQIIEEQSGQQDQEGQEVTPGQEAVPGQDAVPGQETTPGQEVTPGQDAVPGQETTPGQEAAPEQGEQPVQPGGQSQDLQQQNT